MRCKVLLAALALPLASGCMQFDPGADGPVQLSQHVQDWREEVIYQLLVDRFADADEGNNFEVDLNTPGHWHGGDWAGVEQKLPYLHDLGVTTLWISPIVKNVDNDAGFSGYHGYWSQDLTALNPHFGDLPALRRMIASAHGMGMKVILDIVTNHMGQLFYYDINKNGQPDDSVQGGGEDPRSPVIHVNEYDPDFDPNGVQAVSSLGPSGPAPIIFLYDPATNHVPPLPEVFQNPEVYNRKGGTFDFSDPDQLLHGDFPGGLKDIDTTRCDVKQAFVDVYAHWVEETDLDGLRIDTVKHVEREFWRYFSQKIRQRLAAEGKTNFYMFGEAFDGDDELVGSFTKNDAPAADVLAQENTCVTDGVELTGDQLDGVFYFPQYFTAIQNVFHSGGDTKQIEDLWDARKVDFGSEPQQGGIGIPPQEALVNFIDNHDVPRFLFSAGDVAALHNALTFIVMEQGVPDIYYGTEQEFSGGNDPANREDLWSSGYGESGSTFLWIQKLLAIRKKYPAIQKGQQAVRWSTDNTGAEPDAGIFAFERSGGDAGDGYALVVLNTNHDHDSSPSFNGAPMKVGAAAGTVLVDVLSDAQTTYTVTPNQELMITVPKLAGSVLIPQDQL